MLVAALMQSSWEGVCEAIMKFPSLSVVLVYAINKN